MQGEKPCPQPCLPLTAMDALQSPAGSRCLPRCEGKRCRGNCGEGSPSSNRLLSGTTVWSLHHSQPRPMVPHLGFETPNVCFHPSHVRALRQACATVSASVPTSTSHLRSPSSFLSLVSALLKALHHSPSSLGPNMDAICRATMHRRESTEGCTEGWEGY